jgi:hypothetical protein
MSHDSWAHPGHGRTISPVVLARLPSWEGSPERVDEPPEVHVGVDSEPGAVKLQKRVEGTWSLAEGTPQFSTTIAHDDRKTTLHVDMAPPFGGSGLAPDPLQYMLAGLGACYAATLVTIARWRG